MEPPALSDCDESRLVGYLESLPYQEGVPLAMIPEEATTELTESSSGSHSSGQEVCVLEDGAGGSRGAGERRNPHNERFPEDVSNDEVTTEVVGEEKPAARTDRRARNARRAERRRRLREALPVLNLDAAFEVVRSREHNSPLACIASVDVLTRALPPNKYIAYVEELAERCYEQLDRQQNISSVPSRSHRGSSRQPAGNRLLNATEGLSGGS